MHITSCCTHGNAAIFKTCNVKGVLLVLMVLMMQHSSDAAPSSGFGGLISSSGTAAAAENAYTTWWAANDSKKRYSRTAFLSSKAQHNSKEIVAASDAAVALHWTIDHEQSTIQLAVAVKALGWVGLGFTEMGGMHGSDIFLFEAASGSLVDMYALKAGKPILDEQQDWELVDFIAEDGFIIVEVERKLNTGDAMDWALGDDTDYTYMQPGTKLIAAWGDTEQVTYHEPSKRIEGRARLFADAYSAENANNLFRDQMEKEAEGSIVSRVSNYLINSGTKKDIYEFRCFTVAQLIKEQGLPSGVRLNIVGFEWHLAPAKYMHHMSLFSSTSEDISKCNPWSGPTSLVLTWGKGAEPTYSFPPDVGMLLADGSKQGGSAPKSFRLELHYEVPEHVKRRKPPLIDNSGVTLYYTSVLRKHTAAIAQFGDSHLTLRGKPVGNGLQRHTFSCPSTCLQSRMHATKVLHVIYARMHMHNYGLSAHHVQKRNGVEIRRSTAQFYDYRQGSQIVMEDNFEILPGDSFDVICNYDTGNHSPQFGFQSYREMCISTYLYYPATDGVRIMCDLAGTEDDNNCLAEHSALPLSSEEQLGRTFGQANSSADGKADHDEKPGSSSSRAILLSTTLTVSIACFVGFILGVVWCSTRGTGKYKKVSDKDEGAELADERSEHACPIPGDGGKFLRRRFVP